jgi:RimJ/RimL family protein N-acetyltransferase
MIIETNRRMYLVPLTAPQLKLWIEDIATLEKDMNCSYNAEPIDGIFLDIIKKQYEITVKDEANYLFHSFWFLVRKADRIVVGSADFKDLPDINGEVEIGYGLRKAHEHNRYMTEAVQAMCKWAMNQKSVTHVIAETEFDNPKSHNVLKRCGFVQYKHGETLWWKL